MMRRRLLLSLLRWSARRLGYIVWTSMLDGSLEIIPPARGRDRHGA